MAADEDDAAGALLALFPFPLMVAVEDHVHALKDETLGIVLERQDALRAQDVLAFGRHQILHPGEELVGVERLGCIQRNRLHVFIMIVLEAAVIVVMIVAMIVIVVMIVVVSGQELRLDIENTVEIEGIAACLL